MNILKTFQKRLSFKKPIASILFVGALMLIIFYYFNKTIFTNMNSENFENNGQKKVVYFYMDGCPHCDSFSKTWDEFIKISPLPTHKIEGAKAGEMMNTYNISGFPTILLLDENNNKLKELDGPRTVAGLKAMISQ